jgi:citrate synthase
MAEKPSRGLAEVAAASTAPVFSVSRIAGRTAYVIEQQADNALIRPDSECIGESGRCWIPLDAR